MNERIKQLADQCTSYNNSDGWMFDKQKFAELIVRECADVATINAHQWHPPGRFVLTHFGIEE